MLLGLALLLAAVAAACLPGQGRLPERQQNDGAHAVASVSQANPSERSYVGSEACSACHQETYEAWQSTSHAYTVLTADEAQRAGYPLPPESKLTSWSDVSYVIGGRERITYADAAGNVQRESFHHRVDAWDEFPSLPMATCGPCHFTGFGAGIAHPDNPALPGRWAERNIGCESCHGPGSLHVKSYDANDIDTDHSSRSCGGCHTTVGRVLPEDEWHTTHDLVQAWNRDPHVTGGQFHSQSTFCSRCHAPQSAGVLDAQASGDRPVFSENKENITCVGCHNPHDVTSSSYTRDKATLEPPLGANLHAYAGDDADFTTMDFASYSESEQLCVHCHQGADRIELDHANATCTDCHNTFHSNRAVESRIDHDANRPRLSCRQCHRDAEYMMSIVFDDRVFLEPKNIHDLMNLPSDAIRKYELRYPRMARAASRPTGLGRSLAKTSHESSPPRPEPDSLEGSQRSMQALSTGAYTVSTEVLLDFVAAEAETIPPRGTSRLSPDEEASLRARVEHASDAERAWLEGYIALSEDALDEAERWFAVAETTKPEEPSFRYYRGVTALRLGRYEDAADTFEDLVVADPSHAPSRVALGLTHLERNRLLHARKELEIAVGLDVEDPVAHFYLGLAALGQRDLSRAIQAYRTAVDLDPNFFEARYALGRCFRLAGDLTNAERVYRQITRDDPAPFEAHVSLANLYKYLSDRSAIQLLHDRESRAPATMSPSLWRARLDTWEQNAEHYSGLALAELAKALQLRPNDIELKRQVSEGLRRAGSLERAEAYFRWLSEHRPEEWLPRYRLGTILIRREDYSEAIRYLEQAIRTAPTEGDAYSALGFAFVKTGSAHKAIETLELGAVHSPFDPAIHTNLGVAYAEIGDLERARASFERSLELATFPLPRVHITHTNLALVHLKRGDPDDALQELQTALHAFPDYQYAQRLESALQADDLEPVNSYPYVLNDLLERFGEVTTVEFE